MDWDEENSDEEDIDELDWDEENSDEEDIDELDWDEENSDEEDIDELDWDEENSDGVETSPQANRNKTLNKKINMFFAMCKIYKFLSYVNKTCKCKV